MSYSSQIALFMNHNEYKNIVDWYWYQNLIQILIKLEEFNFKFNITEINLYLHSRFLFEHNIINVFDDTKYNIILNNFQVCKNIELKNIQYNYSDYDADTEDDMINTNTIDKLIDHINNIKF